MKHRILIISLLTLALVFSGVYLYFHFDNMLKKEAYQRLRQNLIRDILLAKSFMEQYVARNPLTYSVDRITDNIGKNLGARVTVMGLYGTAIGDSRIDGQALRNMENLLEKPEVREALESRYGEARRLNPATGEDTLYVAATFGGEKPAGIVRLAVPLPAAGLLAGRLKTASFMIMLFPFICVIFGVFAAAKSVRKKELPELSEIEELSRPTTPVIQEDKSVIQEDRPDTPPLVFQDVNKPERVEKIERVERVKRIIDTPTPKFRRYKETLVLHAGRTKKGKRNLPKRRKNAKKA